jgi:hypothetical protein
MGEPVFSHTGQRYVLGYGDDFYGIWDRQAPSTPAWRFAKSNEGWQQAWTEYARLEPAAAPVGGGPGYAAPGTTPSASRYGQGQDPAYGGYPQGPQKTNGFAIASLVLGIVGIWLLAVIFGFVGKSQIDRSRGTQGGRGMAIAGIVLGFVWLAFGVFWFSSISEGRF